MSITKTELKKICLDAGFDLVRIAKPDKKDTFVGDWVKSIIVLAIATLDKSFDYYTHHKYMNKEVYYKFVYEIIHHLSSKVIRKIVSEGYNAEGLWLYFTTDKILLKNVAKRAGLGVFGKNNLLLTKEFGPRIRLTAIFTDIPLEPDLPLEFDFCKDCSLCWKACPTGAIGPDGYNRSLCLAEDDAPTPELIKKRDEIIEKVTTYTFLQCRFCMDVCPVGEKIET